MDDGFRRNKNLVLASHPIWFFKFDHISDWCYTPARTNCRYRSIAAIHNNWVPTGWH